MTDRYDMIFKRKSVRDYDENLTLSENELREIKAESQKLIPLCPDIKVRFDIVPGSATTATRGQYCFMMFSEQKDKYLENAGFMLEQLDLYFAEKNIGACWYGLAKPKDADAGNGLSYVIMFSIGKCRPEDFRTSAGQFTRKSTDEIWQGSFNAEVTEAVRLSPSACNSQPWRIFSDGKTISVFRKTNLITKLSVTRMEYFNSIDMGICFCNLETALIHVGIGFERTLCNEKKGSLIKTAEYRLI